MTKLSIITINYNDAIGLAKTIESVVNQSYSDFEYIVIDGGSTDGSLKIIDKYKDKINFWVSEKDGGIFNAQNKGFKIAKGEYCLFLNSGDFFVDNFVLQNVALINAKEDIIYGNMNINWGTTTTIGKMPEYISFEHMLLDTIWHPVSFIKSSVLKECGGYNEKYKMVADYDFFFKAIISKSVSTKHIPVVIAEYNTEGLSSRPEKKQQELEERRSVIIDNLPKIVADYALQIISKVKGKKKSFKGLIAKFKL